MFQQRRTSGARESARASGFLCVSDSTCQHQTPVRFFFWDVAHCSATSQKNNCLNTFNFSLFWIFLPNTKAWSQYQTLLNQNQNLISIASVHSLHTFSPCEASARERRVFPTDFCSIFTLLSIAPPFLRRRPELPRPDQRTDRTTGDVRSSVSIYLSRNVQYILNGISVALVPSGRLLPPRGLDSSSKWAVYTTVGSFPQGIISCFPSQVSEAGKTEQGALQLFHTFSDIFHPWQRRCAHKDPPHYFQNVCAACLLFVN